MLINNTEVNYYCNFKELSIKKAKEIFMINCMPTTLLTHRIIPHMLKRNQKSAIINLSSQAAEMTIKRQALFCGTKRYIDYFSRSLAEEFRNKIDILSFK
jgi:hypothetical protein